MKRPKCFPHMTTPEKAKLAGLNWKIERGKEARLARQRLIASVNERVSKNKESDR